VSTSSTRLVDYHVHSKLSVDGESSVDDLCRHAVELEVAEIGFSEHVEFEPKDSGFGFFDYERYHETLDRARSQYAGKLTIRKGVEVDYNHECEAQIQEWLEGKDFDFVMGTVHYIDHIAFDLGWNNLIPARVTIEKYYTKIRQAAESGLFNVIGHLDLIRDHVSVDLKSASPVTDMIDMTFEKMIAHGAYLEINSRRRTDQEPYPSKSLILRYLDKGGERFSFGSDAHSVQQVALGIAEAMNLLRSLGPKTIHTLFE